MMFWTDNGVIFSFLSHYLSDKRNVNCNVIPIFELIFHILGKNICNDVTEGFLIVLLME